MKILFVIFALLMILISFSKGKLDIGWANLEKGKRMWKSLQPGLIYHDGIVEKSASAFANHANILEAKRLINHAIDFAPQSNIEPLRAIANKSIAWQELGLLHRVINEFEEAGAAYNNSIELLNKVGGSNSSNKYILSAFREITFRIGELNHARGDFVQAKEYYLASLGVDNKLGHDEPYGEQFTKDLLGRLNKTSNMT